MHMNRPDHALEGGQGKHQRYHRAAPSCQVGLVDTLPQRLAGPRPTFQSSFQTHLLVLDSCGGKLPEPAHLTQKQGLLGWVVPYLPQPPCWIKLALTPHLPKYSMVGRTCALTTYCFMEMPEVRAILNLELTGPGGFGNCSGEGLKGSKHLNLMRKVRYLVPVTVAFPPQYALTES